MFVYVKRYCSGIALKKIYFYTECGCLKHVKRRVTINRKEKHKNRVQQCGALMMLWSTSFSFPSLQYARFIESQRIKTAEITRTLFLSLSPSLSSHAHHCDYLRLELKDLRYFQIIYVRE